MSNDRIGYFTVPCGAEPIPSYICVDAVEYEKCAAGPYTLYLCITADEGISCVTPICFVTSPLTSCVFKPKYSMTKEQNIFVAKRNIVDYIYKSAKLEGLGVTYPDTETIYNGMAAQGSTVRDVVTINNLKRAWQFVLDTLDPPVDYAYVCKINQIVGGDNAVFNAGYLRMLPVSIGGTAWRPEIPDADVVKERLRGIQALGNPLERAITLMLYCMRAQLFLDGNKHTAMLVANKEMIAAGQGVLSIPIEHQPKFRELLIAFYETGMDTEIKQFLYENCIDGIPFDNVGGS